MYKVIIKKRFFYLFGAKKHKKLYLCSRKSDTDCSMIEYLDHIDRQLMLMLNYDGGVVLDQFWYWFSAKWTWVPMYVVILACMVRHDYQTCHTERTSGKYTWLTLYLLQIICVALVITAADQIASHLIKPMVCRLRPAQDPLLMEFIHIVNGDRGYKYGFVSSHASNTWALTVYLAYIFRNRYVNLYMAVWATLTCYSRIYLGVHYPGDILGGTIVGIASSYLIMKYIYTPISSRLFSRQR